MLFFFHFANLRKIGKSFDQTLHCYRVEITCQPLPLPLLIELLTTGRMSFQVPLQSVLSVTKRAMKEAYIGTIINFIDKVLTNADDVNVISTVKNEVKEFMKQFPLYPELG